MKSFMEDFLKKSVAEISKIILKFRRVSGNIFGGILEENSKGIRSEIYEKNKNSQKALLTKASVDSL